MKIKQRSIGAVTRLLAVRKKGGKCFCCCQYPGLKIPVRYCLYYTLFVMEIYDFLYFDDVRKLRKNSLKMIVYCLLTRDTFMSLTLPNLAGYVSKPHLVFASSSLFLCNDIKIWLDLVLVRH